MTSSVGICHTFNDVDTSKQYRIKEKTEDFVVQEVVDSKRCTISSILDLEKYMEADRLINGQLDENLSKEERKELYSITNYHPLKRMYTKDGHLCVEDNSTDVFVFTVLKYDYSSFSLRTLLARRLGVHQNAVQMGGTKDKHAITIQEVSVKCSFDKLFSYAFALSRNKKIAFEDLGYSQGIENTNMKLKEIFERQIKVDLIDTHEDVGIYNIRRGVHKKLGDLDGNYFSVKINGLTKISKTPTKFYNYFGIQRFGVNMNNHVIGKKILNKEYQDVIDMIMNDPCILPDKQSYTQKLISRMLESGKKPKYIVDALPRDIRMTYLHAYQSFLFNQSLNSRIENEQPDIMSDMISVNGELVQADETSKLEDIYIPLEKMNDKLLKGGMRKMVENFEDFEAMFEENSTVLKFFLRKSCYATVALREIVGDVDQTDDN